MLVPFIVDADSLAPEPTRSPADERDSHAAFLDVWGRIGHLIYEGQTFEASRLRQRIDQLPQAIRSLWMEFLDPALMSPSQTDWKGCICHGTLEQIAAEASVAFVDETCAFVELNMPETDLPTMVRGENGVEVCLFRRAIRSRMFKDAIQRSGTHIPRGQGFETTWSERFRSLARARIKLIAVVDRYAVSKHLRCPQSHLSGIERFVRLLDRDATGPRYVTVFSAFADGVRAAMLPKIEESFRSMMQKLPKRNVSRLKLVMGPNFLFGQSSHGRFIRFGDYVWDLDLGLEIFEGSCSSARCGTAFKARNWADGYREIEREIESHSKTISRIITP
jgi:hypothetical protein